MGHLATVAGRVRARRDDLIAGIVLAGLIACAVVGWQLGDAAGELQALRARVDLLGEPQWPDIAWPLTAASCLALAVKAERILLARLDQLGVEAPTPSRFRWAWWAGVLAWTWWQLTGMAVFWGGDRLPAASGALWLAFGAAFAAALLAAAVIGDPRTGWKRAWVVRVHLIVLSGIALAVFVAPVTAAQMHDVLRGWGDGPLSRVACGVAGALVLGAVVRTSAGRLLVPLDRGRRYPGTAPALAGVAVAGLLLSALNAWLGLAVLAACVFFVVVTTWDDPAEDIDPRTKHERRRLAGTLGVIPLGVVYTGLLIALTDTLLLPSRLTRTDVWLIAITVGVGAAFAVSAASAHPLLPDGEEGPAQAGPGARLAAAAPAPPKGSRWLAPAVAIVALGLGALAQLDVVSVALVVGAALIAWLGVPDDRAPEFWAAGGVALGVGAAVYLDPVDASRDVGALGVFFFAVAALLTLLHLPATLARRRLISRGGPRLRGRRVPIVALLVAWVVLALALPPEDIRQIRSTKGGIQPGELQAAVDGWLERAGAERIDRVPMVLMAASGGGAKAAYWTALVVDCLFGGGPPPAGAMECPATRDDDRYGNLFLTSSVSGGSIGVARLVEHRRPDDPWVDSSLGEEVLSPLLAWGLFHDLPAFMLRAPTDPRRCQSPWTCARHADRALVQEAAIAGRDDLPPPERERMLVDRPEGAPPRYPVTVFNAAADGADQRVLLAPVLLDARRPKARVCRRRLGPELGSDVLDAHDLLAGSPMPDPAPDVPLVTAALASARFPVLEPRATIGEDRKPDPADPCAVGSSRTLVRDGGYIENSGMLTLEELLPELRRAIDVWVEKNHRAGVDVPIVVVSADDDPMAGGGDPELNLLPRPFGIGARAGPGNLTRGARDRMTNCRRSPNTHYERVSPGSHAGAEAATGWELSRTAREKDLVKSLRAGEPAWEAVDRIREVIAGRKPVRCAAR